MMTRTTTILTIGFFLSCVPLVTAQPANDDCADASIVDAGTIPFSTVGATTDGPEVCAPYEADVWFRFRPDQGGTLIVSTCSPALTFDTVLSIFVNRNQRCDNTPLACNDDAIDPNCPPSGSTVRLVVRSDRTYLIHVGGFDGRTGSGELTIRLCPGDFDGDGSVALTDLALLLQELWFSVSANCGIEACGTDLDGDGDVDLVDVAILLSLFGTYCP